MPARTATLRLDADGGNISRNFVFLDNSAWYSHRGLLLRSRPNHRSSDHKLRQDFALQNKIAEIEQRGRDGRAAIRRELEEARKADIPATGPRRVFLIATGRDMREAFDRQGPRDATDA
jgi:hypothetical protein